MKTQFGSFCLQPSDARPRARWIDERCLVSGIMTLQYSYEGPRIQFYDGSRPPTSIRAIDLIYKVDYMFSFLPTHSTNASSVRFLRNKIIMTVSDILVPFFSSLSFNENRSSIIPSNQPYYVCKKEKSLSVFLLFSLSHTLFLPLFLISFLADRITKWSKYSYCCWARMLDFSLLAEWCFLSQAALSFRLVQLTPRFSINFRRSDDTQSVVDKLKGTEI